ncbi:hypothetical protein J1N35_008433 [Gossypium stocksii]|uniref:Uncharacterized protein n=1 Tax=Gossypium stocksii TaxID=47602 RepID=A0A9D3WAC6_9ROSI|nr:hypothetical protein J1N35_008433 [Gossypium stocksii]
MPASPPKVWPLLCQSLAWSTSDDNFIKVWTGILPPSPLAEQDDLISNWSINGKFTVKYAYNFLMQNSLNPYDNKWKLAWLEISVDNTMSKRRCQAWKPPPSGFIKLNTDEAKDPNLGLALAATVAKDDVGT